MFRIPYLKAGVGYFGLAQLTNQEFFSSWLPNFINNNSDVTSLGKFAESLRDALNRVVNRALLSRNVQVFIFVALTRTSTQNSGSFEIVRFLTMGFIETYKKNIIARKNSFLNSPDSQILFLSMPPFLGTEKNITSMGISDPSTIFGNN